MSARFPAQTKAVLGPTNTGKTFLAIERMLGHQSGMIGLPLRLLAREVYDRCVAAKGAPAVALITGEEKIAPETARYFVCTVEAMPLDKSVEFLAIDEIQVAGDPDRGHIFTDRILHARGRGETMLLGSDTMRPMLRRLLPEAEITRRERLSTLAYVGVRKITKLPKRSAVVAFSAEEVYAIAELLRRQRGGAAVVMGALSPRTRNAQVALYQSGEVDFLVATDAIGMGLNMDVDHVAFASRRKFDGRRWRDLRPDEVAQIAGRAGRFKTDGAFGETGECEPFDEETIERVENHDFEPIEAIQWRSAELRFDSVAALIASLERAPQRPGLTRVRGAEDEEVLKLVIAEPEIADLAREPRGVKRLWEACQLPDFRKASPEEHARLVGRIALHILSPKGRIPSEWIGAEIEKLDRSEGDLDVLQQRLAHVRTWTYAANRADWLNDKDGWRDRARAIEDKLSDALHAALTQRFIDRRTSALLKSLKREDLLLAGVTAEGEVSVEGHFVGRLEGLDFKPDPRALGLEGRAVRNAAWRALRPEVTARLRAIASAQNETFELGKDGRIRFRKAAIAKLEPGGALLKPRLTLIGGDAGAEADRHVALARLEAWIAEAIAQDLAPFVALDRAQRDGRLTGAARGIAFRLTENCGGLDRAEAADLVGELTREGRAELGRLGVRIGRHTLYLPALLHPSATRLLAILRHWTLDAPPPRAPFLPGGRAMALPIPRDVSWSEAAACGYRPLGRLAVRFDSVERLAEALHAQRANSAGDFAIDPNWARIVRRSAHDLPAILAALGYRRIVGDQETPTLWRLPAQTRAPRPHRRPVDSPFAVLAEIAQPPQRAKRRRRRNPPGGEKA
jgi:ATP-dependent RNA helicase SUPV3L1/SUV3